MKTHNFADWEITNLLPSRKTSNLFRKGVKIGNVKVFNSEGEDISAEYLWTWEDIRLYLESKGYHINYNYNDITKEVDVLVLKFVEDVLPATVVYGTYTFDTYEEARKNAIIFILDKLNNNEQEQR